MPMQGSKSARFHGHGRTMTARARHEEKRRMRRRNGNGSQQLQEVTEKLRRGEQKRVRVLEDEGLISNQERSLLLTQIQRSVAQKRSSEVLATAHTIHNKL